MQEVGKRTVLTVRKYLRNAASSSGDAFFWTSCNNRMAASTSGCVFDTRDTFEPFFRLASEFRLLLTNDRSADPDLECVREFDLETTVERRPRPSTAASVSNMS